MELPEFVDAEVFYSLGYWALALGAPLALLIGFKSTSLWGTELQVPLVTKVLSIVLMPVIAYFFVLYHKKR